MSTTEIIPDPREERYMPQEIPCPQCQHAVRYSRPRVTCPACGWAVDLAPTEADEFVMMFVGCVPYAAQFLAVIAARCCPAPDAPGKLYYDSRAGKWIVPPGKGDDLITRLNSKADQAELNGVTLYRNPKTGKLLATSQQRNAAAGPYEIRRDPATKRFLCECPAGQRGELCAHLALYWRHLGEKAWYEMQATLIAQFTPVDPAETRRTPEEIAARAQAAYHDLYGDGKATRHEGIVAQNSPLFTSNSQEGGQAA